MANLPKYPNQPSETELTDFLTKVDEIESVIKGLNSNDDQERSNYMKKADDLIKKVSKQDTKNKDKEDEEDDLPQTRTVFSKTSINKDAYSCDLPPQTPVLEGPVDQKAFMAAMEADAKERSERRKQREKVATEYKEQGNAEFRQGNYQKALEFYNKALEQVRDNSVLYTNRAQAKIKLGLNSEALSDCDWALKIWPCCMKAYVYKGHAYLGLKEYEEARDSYRHILTIDSRKENMVKGYVAEVDRQEQASQEESRANQLFKEGDQSVKDIVELLTRINHKDQLPVYYAGGFRVIASVLNDADSRSVFRANNGLQVPASHAALIRCLSANPHSLSAEERDMLSAAFDMLAAACKNNETSQQQLLSLPEFPSQLLAILEVRIKGQGRLLKTSCLNLLHEVSVTEAGRAALVSRFDISRFIPALFRLMMRKSTYASTAAALLNNIALDKRVKAMLRDNIEEEILPEFENLLQSIKTSPSIAGLASSVATNLAGDVTIRNKMASRAVIWKSAAKLLISYTASRFCTPLEHLLGLLVNLSTGVDSSSLKNIDPEVISSCYTIVTSKELTDLATARSLAILSNVAVHSEAAVNFLCDRSRLLTILEFMKNENPLFYKSALKCMTAMTQNSEAAVTLAENKGTSVVLAFLNSTDEVTIGNAALCLTHMCQIEKVCAKLTKSNIIQKLLVFARDGRRPEVQSNCAILLGKLAQGDRRHLERLRELHGIEILHGCMKHIK